MFKSLFNSVVTNLVPTQQSQTAQSPQPAGSGQVASPNHFYINQQFKIGRESFAVTDGKDLVYEAKLKMFTIKEHIDVYHDKAASKLAFTIQQNKAMAISKAYEVKTADGKKIGGFKLEAMQSMVKEHWDILDANDNPIGAVDQNAMTAMAGRFVSDIIPQSFVATMNGQRVCEYKEEMNIGMFFKMDIDFSGDTAGIYDKTLGVAGAVLLATKHMQTK
jgi:hypothetical protein